MFVRIFKRWLPTLLWMGAIFVLSAQPAQELPDLGWWDFFLKKTAHFGAYAILAALVYWGGMREGKGTFLPAFLLTVLYAASDEYHQTFVPGRNGTIGDVLLDAAGALAGLSVIYRSRIRQKRMLSPTPMSDRP